MPEMDGFQFLDELDHRDAWRDVPVLAMTAKELVAEHRTGLNGSNHKRELIESRRRDDGAGRHASNVADPQP